MNDKEPKEVEKIATLRRAISGMWTGFIAFSAIIIVYGLFLAPLLLGLLGPLTSPLGAVGQFLTLFIVLFVTYRLYAFIVKRFNADPESE